MTVGTIDASIKEAGQRITKSRDGIRPKIQPIAGEKREVGGWTAWDCRYVSAARRGRTVSQCHIHAELDNLVPALDAGKLTSLGLSTRGTNHEQSGKHEEKRESQRSSIAIKYLLGPINSNYRAECQGHIRPFPRELRKHLLANVST